MRARIAAAAVLMLAATVASLPAAGQPRPPKGHDQRVIADSRAYPWRAVGRLNKAGRGHCSATVVAPKLVLTAAHCVWHRGLGAIMPLDDIHFVAGWDRGDYVFHSTAAEVHLSPDWDPMRTGRLANAAHDWAVIVLQQDPAPETGVVPLGTYDRKTFWAYRKADTVFSQAGYSGDRGQVLTVHEDCPMWGFVDGLTMAIHKCQAFPGDSGSPILYQDTAGDWRIAAMHVAHETSRVTGRGFAVPETTFAPTVRKLAGE